MMRMPEHPFVGLRPFESHEALLFFGRREQIKSLLQQLHRTHFLGVVGSSGCGKSSLVRAGLIPHLEGGFLVEDRDQWRVATCKPGGGPFLYLTQALYHALGETWDLDACTELAQQIREGGLPALLDFLREPLQQQDANLLVLVDQFEEIFRYRSESDPHQEEAAEFVALLLQLAEQRDLPIFVTLTMRSDFLGDCDLFWGLPEAMNEGQYLVPRLTRQQRRESIVGPIRLFQGSISGRLLDRLLNRVGDNRDDLPLLQHTLMRTWDYARTHHPEERELDVPYYQAVGGLERALSQHADEAFEELSEADQDLAKRLFQALSQVDEKQRAIRRPVRLNELLAVTQAPVERIWAVLNTFREQGRSFVVFSSANPDDDPVVDISHESLLRQWVRLERWILQETEYAKIYLRLAQTAQLHQEDKAGYYLDPDLALALNLREALQPSEAWARRYHPDYKLALDFLQASEAHQAQLVQAQEQEAGRRARRKRNTIITTLIILFLLAIAGVSYWQRNEAYQDRKIAEERGTKAEMDLRQAEQARDEAKMSRRIAEQAKNLAEQKAYHAAVAQFMADSLRQKALQNLERARMETSEAEMLARMAIMSSDVAREREREAQTLIANSFLAEANAHEDAGDWIMAWLYHLEVAVKAQELGKTEAYASSIQFLKQTIPPVGILPSLANALAGDTPEYSALRARIYQQPENTFPFIFNGQTLRIEALQSAVTGQITDHALFESPIFYKWGDSLAHTSRYPFPYVEDQKLYVMPYYGSYRSQFAFPFAAADSMEISFSYGIVDGEGNPQPWMPSGKDFYDLTWVLQMKPAKPEDAEPVAMEALFPPAWDNAGRWQDFDYLYRDFFLSGIKTKATQDQEQLEVQSDWIAARVDIPELDQSPEGSWIHVSLRTGPRGSYTITVNGQSDTDYNEDWRAAPNGYWLRMFWQANIPTTPLFYSDRRLVIKDWKVENFE